NNEVTVPAVHFIEAPAGYNVLIRQIEQAGWIDIAARDLAQPINFPRQMFDAHFTFSAEFAYGRGLFQSRRQILYRGLRDLRIDDALATRHRSRERIPGLRDVVQDRLQALLAGSIGGRGPRGGTKQQPPGERAK